MPGCPGASHSTEWWILEERPSMHGTTSLLVPETYDRANDSVTTYCKLEAVSVPDTKARACFLSCRIATEWGRWILLALVEAWHDFLGRNGPVASEELNVVSAPNRTPVFHNGTNLSYINPFQNVLRPVIHSYFWVPRRLDYHDHNVYSIFLT